MKIAFYPCDEWAVGYYRNRLPAEGLKRTTNHQIHMESHELMAASTVSEAKFREVLDYDIHVFQRVYNPAVLAFIKALKHVGKKVVVDMDDNLLCVPRHNPAWGPNEVSLPIVVETIKEASLVTVTNQRLVDVYKKYNDNIHIFGNYIDFERINKAHDEREPRPTRPRIFGWAGSSSHKEDLMALTGTFQSLEDDGSWELDVVGEERPVFDFVFKGVDYLQLSHVPFDKYYHLLTQMDVGMAPLTDTTFTRGKSYLKALEYNAAGVLPVCSRTIVYEDYIRDGYNGFLVKEGQWLKTIKRLVAMPDEDFQTLIENGVEFSKRYDITKHTHKLEKIYATL